MKWTLLSLLALLTATGNCGTIIETEAVKVLKPTGSLATCGYKPATAEQAYFSKLEASETKTGSFIEPYTIHKKKDKYVSWFAVVRGITPSNEAKDRYDLLLEHKFFDGLTDCHIMLVSASGDGDFRASVENAKADSVPLLALVRVYGKVTEEESGVPLLTAEYIRVWPWLTFTLTDLGPADHSNPKWRQLCKVCKSGHIYNPYPTEAYYRNALGDPNDFASQAVPAK